MKLGVEFEYTGRHDPVPSFTITVTIPWHCYFGWGSRCRVWRFYGRN
jgi:hypothetical protein